MCSWCWGYRPTSDSLFENLPDDVELVYVLGGLAPDSDEPMPDDMRQAIPQYWQKIQDMLGTEFNFDFWTECVPRRSTYPSCRAVIAASNQDKQKQMIDAIQRGYYLRAMNPSDNSTLIQFAKELGLDVGNFENDLSSEETEAELQRQLSFTRSSPVTGFPSLVLVKDNKYYPVAVDYKDYQITLDEITAISRD